MVCALCAALLLLLAVPALAAAETFTVNTNADVSTEGCVVECSLRTAIQSANSDPGADTIDFAEAAEGTIDLETELPAISGAVTIDGTSAPGYEHEKTPVVEIDGHRAFEIGLWVRTPGEAVIKGLDLGGFHYDVYLEGADSRICSSWIGFELEGDPMGGSIGVRVASGSSDAEIGTECGAGAAPNVIGGNTSWGIEDYGQSTAIGNTRVGIGPFGESLANGVGGVRVTTQAQGTTVGSVAGGEPQPNVIADNGNPGVNQGPGVLVEGSAARASVRGNSISRNAGLGIEVQSGGGSVPPIPTIETVTPVNGDEVQITGTISGTEGEMVGLDFYANEICDPSGSGEGETYLGTGEAVGVGEPVHFSADLPTRIPARETVVTATATGISARATSAFSNCVTYQEPARTLTVDTLEDRANPGECITVCSLREAIEYSNLTEAEDTIDFAESAEGTIKIEFSSLPEITNPVVIDGTSAPHYEGTPVVQLDGSALEGGEEGRDEGLVVAPGGEGTEISGMAIGGFNFGVWFHAPEGAQLCASYVGVEPDGVTALPNGVGVESSSFGEENETVGNQFGAGCGAVGGNLISGNEEYGVKALGPETEVAADRIGIDATGAPLPNGTEVEECEDCEGEGGVDAGVFVGDAAGGSTIGGVTGDPNPANVIAYNHGFGVQVESGSSNVAIRGNSIFENESLGIEVGEGAPPPPGITSAISPAEGEFEVKGVIDGEEGEEVELDFFASKSCDQSSAGEGETYLGSGKIAVGDGGGPYSFNLPVHVSPHATAITATVTTHVGATSEFSTCADYVPGPQTFVVNTLEDTSHGECGTTCSLRDAIEAANETAAKDTIEFDVAGAIKPDEEDLPGIEEPVVIDGTTAPGYGGSPVVEIDGSEALNEGPTVGLELNAIVGGTVLKGLAITNFGYGVIVRSDESELNDDVISHDPEYGVYVTASAPETAIRRTELFEDHPPIFFEVPNSVPAPELEAFVAGTGETTFEVPITGANPEEPYAIDVFANAQCEASEPGPAEVFLGSGTVTTDEHGEGLAVFKGRTLTGVDAESFTATATELSSGTTSQIGGCAHAPLPETQIESHPPAVTSAIKTTFTFSASSYGHIEGYECSLDSLTFTPNCASPKQYSDLADGSHTFKVRAVNGEGFHDNSPAEYTWEVDTEPPTVSITGGPPATTKATAATFEFTGSDSGSGISGYECSLEGEDPEPCTSPEHYTGFTSGPHEFEVVAIDEAGNESAPAVRTWTVVTEAPSPAITGAPPASTESTSATFEFAATDTTSPIVGYECSLDGAVFAPCVSPQSFSGLAPGVHVFAVRSIDEAGNTSEPTVHQWTVAAPPPTTPAAAEEPTPTNGEAVVVAPKEGKVLIKLPGTDKYVPLEELKEIPVGAVIDATNGKVTLTSIGPNGEEQSAVFFGGVFKVKQAKGKSVVVVELIGNKVCRGGMALPEEGTATASSLMARASSISARPGGKKGGKLWGSGHGNFTTEGSQGSATVRGTIWFVEDRCDGTTFFKTKRGIVTVKDFSTGKTFSLPAGNTYTAGEE